MNSTAAHSGEIKGRHVLAAMLLFFLAIIAINIGFTVVAIKSFPGEDVKRSYLQGLNYNEKLAERAAQARLGWTAAMIVAPRSAGAELRVRFADREGRPLSGLAIEGVLRRPATTREDRPVTFQDAGDGLYLADLAALPPGGWVFQGKASRGDERFEFERRMTWTPLQP